MECMQDRSLEEIIIEESNAYFDRNKDAITDVDEASKSAHLIDDFLERYLSACPGSIKKILEIGCNYGYNLNYLSNRHGVNCWGIEPSDKAVEYGKSRYGNHHSQIHITQGISNNLSFGDSEFDMVIMGFLMYVTPRDMIDDTVFEANRVLKQGGFIVLTDFDVPIPYKRKNKHNDTLSVYKEDYARRFIPMGYSIAEKYTYSQGGVAFHPDIQERISTQFLYKEITEDLYVDSSQNNNESEEKERNEGMTTETIRHGGGLA